VLRTQLGGLEHRLAELNHRLAGIGPGEPAALPLLLDAADCYLRKNDYATQKRYAVQAQECAAGQDDRAGVARAGMSLAVASCWTGDLEEARAYSIETARYLDRLDDRALARELSVLLDLSWVEGQMQWLAAAEEHQRRGLRVAEASGAESEAMLLHVLLGATLREMGRLGEARAHTSRALAGADRRNSAAHRELALIGHSEIASEAGDWRLVRKLAAAALAAAGPYAQLEPAAHLLSGLALIHTGQPLDGRDLVLDAAGGKRLPLVPVAARTKVHAALAAAAADLGHYAEARRWSELARETTCVCGLDRTRGYAQLASAEALLRSDPDQAQRAARSALAAFERAGIRLGSAAAYRVIGAAQKRLDPSAATSALRSAEELYRSCAAIPAADSVRLMRTDPDPAAAGVAGQEQAVLGCLSPREADVARLIAKGDSNRQIASELDIKLNTVQVHVGRILHKLQVPSRAGVARLITLAELDESTVIRN
jgi:DNA-binding NarL/FixJ family response regulator